MRLRSSLNSQDSQVSRRGGGDSQLPKPFLDILQWGTRSEENFWNNTWCRESVHRVPSKGAPIIAMILLEDSVFNGIYKSSLKFYSLYSLLLSLFYVSQRHCYSIADVYFFFLNIFLHLCSSITHRGVDIKREKGKVLENVALAVKSSQVSEEKREKK